MQPVFSIHIFFLKQKKKWVCCCCCFKYVVQADLEFDEDKQHFSLRMIKQELGDSLSYIAKLVSGREVYFKNLVSSQGSRQGYDQTRNGRLILLKLDHEHMGVHYTILKFLLLKSIGKFYPYGMGTCE